MNIGNEYSSNVPLIQSAEHNVLSTSPSVSLYPLSISESSSSGKRPTEPDDSSNTSKKKKTYIICSHNKRRTDCLDCGGSGICKHGRRRRICKACGGKCICEHGRQRHSCSKCKISKLDHLPPSLSVPVPTRLKIATPKDKSWVRPETVTDDDLLNAFQFEISQALKCLYTDHTFSNTKVISFKRDYSQYIPVSTLSLAAKEKFASPSQCLRSLTDQVLGLLDDCYLRCLIMSYLTTEPARFSRQPYRNKRKKFNTETGEEMTGPIPWYQRESDPRYADVGIIKQFNGKLQMVIPQYESEIRHLSKRAKVYTCGRKSTLYGDYTATRDISCTTEHYYLQLLKHFLTNSVGRPFADYYEFQSLIQLIVDIESCFSKSSICRCLSLPAPINPIVPHSIVILVQQRMPGSGQMDDLVVSGTLTLPSDATIGCLERWILQYFHPSFRQIGVGEPPVTEVDPQSGCFVEVKDNLALPIIELPYWMQDFDPVQDERDRTDTYLIAFELMHTAYLAYMSSLPIEPIEPLVHIDPAATGTANTVPTTTAATAVASSTASASSSLFSLLASCLTSATDASSSSSVGTDLTGSCLNSLQSTGKVNDDMMSVLYENHRGFECIRFDLVPYRPALIETASTTSEVTRDTVRAFENVPVVVGSHEQFVKSMSADLQRNHRDSHCRSVLRCRDDMIAVCDALPSLEETFHRPARNLVSILEYYKHEKHDLYCSKKISQQYSTVLAWTNTNSTLENYQFVLSVIARTPRLPDHKYPQAKKYLNHNIKQFW